MNSQTDKQKQLPPLDPPLYLVYIVAGLILGRNHYFQNDAQVMIYILCIKISKYCKVDRTCTDMSHNGGSSWGPDSL